MHQNWGGTVVIPGKFFKTIPDMQYHRNLKDNWVRFTNTGSWHFSYMGTAQDIIDKVASYVHNCSGIEKKCFDNIASNVNDIKDPLGSTLKFLLKKVDDR
jgi:hypothetical protein